MPNAQELVQPKATAPTPKESEPVTDGGLSDELLQIPAVQGLMAGSPAAISATIDDFQKRPEANIIIQQKPALMKAGIGFYRALDGGTGVVFNQSYLSGDELKAADKAGQLAQIAPPFDVVNSEIAKSGANNPVINAAPPTAFRTAPVPEVPQTANVSSASSGVQTQSQRARVKNLQPKGPISGPKPGAGRLLNTVLTPVI